MAGTLTVKDSASWANDFMAVFKRAAEGADKERARLLGERAKLLEQREQVAEALAAVDRALSDLEQNIAVGLKVAAREAGVKLEIDAKRNGQGASGNIKRASKDELESAYQRVLCALPPKGKVFVTFGEVAGSLKIDASLIKTALARGKRQGTILTNGKVGRAGGYQRA